MKKRDYQAFEEARKILEKAFVNVMNDIEDYDIFNSEKALKLIDKYTSIHKELKELVYDIHEYFGDNIVE